MAVERRLELANGSRKSSHISKSFGDVQCAPLLPNHGLCGLCNPLSFDLLLLALSTWSLRACGSFSPHRHTAIADTSRVALAFQNTVRGVNWIYKLTQLSEKSVHPDDVNYQQWFLMDDISGQTQKDSYLPLSHPSDALHMYFY